MNGRTGVTLGLLSLLTACVAAPPRQPPRVETVPPDQWTAVEVSGETSVPPVEGWWTTFRDPRLTEVVTTALRENHDLKAAAARLERAVAAARIASADLKPLVSGGLDVSRQRFNFIGFPIPGTTISTRADLGVDVSWEADLWGRIRAGARAALANLQATEADLYGARLSIAGQAAKAWFAVLEARQQVELARDTVRSRRTSTGQIRSRFRRGLRPAIDLRLAEANLATAEALIELRRAQLDAATRRLEALLGQYPGGRLLQKFGAADLPASPGPIPAGLPADLIARRPDLVAAERRLAATDQRARQARRALYPRLTLTGSGGTASDQLGDLLDGDFRVWALVGGLTQPLFQGGRLRAGVDLADAAVRESAEIYAGAALQAYAEVEAALAAEEFLARREEREAVAAGHLVAARHLAEERYTSGVGDYLTVLESQTRELVVRSNLLAVRRQRLDNRIDLHLALGGGFDVVAGRTGLPGEEMDLLEEQEGAS